VATVKRYVETEPGKKIVVEVPENWGPEEIRGSLIEKGILKTPEQKNLEALRPDVQGTPEEGEDAASLISRKTDEYVRKMESTTGGPKTYTHRPSEPSEGGTGFLMWTLEKLDRPRSAVVAGVQGLLDGDNVEDVGKIMKDTFMTGENHPLMGDYIFDRVNEEAKKPIQERNPLVMPPWISFAYDKYPHETIAAMSTIGGIFADIGLDPITYTGIGVTKKGEMVDSAFSLMKDGIDIADHKMMAYIKDLLGMDDVGHQALRKYAIEGGEQFATKTSEKLAQGQMSMRIAGVPIPGVISGKAVGLTEKLIEKIKGTKAGDDAWKLFSTKAGLTPDTVGFADIEERFKNVAAMARYHSVQENKEIARDIRQLHRATGVSVKEINRFITDSVERGGVGAVRMAGLSAKEMYTLAHDPVLLHHVRELSRKNAFQLSIEQSRGVRIAEFGASDYEQLVRLDETMMYAARRGHMTAVNPLTGKVKSLSGLKADRDELAQLVQKQDRISYIRHALTPKAKRIVMKERGALESTPTGGRVFSLQHASTLERKFRDMTIDEINAAAKKGTLKGYEGIKFPSGFFESDPSVIQTIRDIHHRRTIALADMLDDTKERFGISLDDLREKFGKNLTSEQLLDKAGISGYRLARNPKVQALTKGMAFPDEIATRLEQHYETFFDPQQVNTFLKGYDEIQNWWKAYTLGIFPAYHFRNAVGNVWNNFVTGTKDFSVYGTAQGIQRGAKGTIKTTDGRVISYDQIRQHLDELGVHNRGFIATDIEQAIKSELGGAKWLSLTRNAKAIRMGQVVGTAVENNARIAKFVDELQKGKGFFDASQEVKRALFDYQDLTRFEKSTMKRLMPFYTWSRKNIPLQVEQMIKHPGRYKGVDTVRMNVENTNYSPEDPNEYVLNDWMLESYPMRVGWENVPQADGSSKRLPRYFLFGGWLPAADVWKLASAPQQLVIDNITPLIKAVGEPWSGKDWFTWNELDADIKQDFLGMRLNQKQIKVLKNLRVLTAADNLAKSLGMYEQTPPLIPNPAKQKTPEETLISFFTGIRTYRADLEKQRQRKLQDWINKTPELTKKMRKQLIIGTTKDEFSELTKKLTDEQVQELKKLMSKSKTER